MSSLVHVRLLQWTDRLAPIVVLSSERLVIIDVLPVSLEGFGPGSGRLLELGRGKAQLGPGRVGQDHFVASPLPSLSLPILEPEPGRIAPGAGYAEARAADTTGATS
jgi:hypothetical protein